MDRESPWRYPELVRVHLTAGMILLIASACSQEPQTTLACESEHFRYHVQGTQPQCDRLTGWLEHYALSLERLLGSPPQTIDYFLYRDTASLEDAGCDALGCARDSQVKTVMPVHAHELVHAFAHPVGNPPHMFSEGLASVLGCINDPPAPQLTSADNLITTNGFDNWDTGEAYSTAASFVRHLVDRYGYALFLELYARLPHDASRDQIARAFADTLPTTLDDEIASWATSPPLDVCDWRIECAMMEIAPEQTLNVTLMTGRSGPPAELPFRVDIPDAAVLTVDFAGAGTRDMLIHRCAGGLVHAADARNDAPYSVPVEAGSYLVRVRADNVDSTYQLRWSALPTISP